jgi:hypothetical protein
MPRFTISADTPGDIDDLRAVLKRRLAGAWPQRPDPTTLGTDVPTLEKLIASLDACRDIAEQLRQLAAS